MKAPQCKCGCGEYVTQNQNSKRWNVFILGHHMRVASRETRRKIGDASKKRGISKKTKQKLSLIMKGRPSNMKGKKHSEKTKRKMSASTIGQKHTEEAKVKISIAKMECRTDDYCDAWSDTKYKDECRKDHCEFCNRNKNDGWHMNLHHKDHDKKNCHPNNLQTLCVRCHSYHHRNMYNPYKLKLEEVCY